MPNLQTLSISREYYGLHLKQLGESGEEWPKLKELPRDGFSGSLLQLATVGWLIHTRHTVIYKARKRGRY